MPVPGVPPTCVPAPAPAPSVPSLVSPVSGLAVGFETVTAPLIGRAVPDPSTFNPPPAPKAVGSRAIKLESRWAILCKRPFKPLEAVSVAGAVSVTGPVNTFAAN